MASTSKDHSGMPAAAMVSAQLPSSSATVPSVSAAQQAEDEARKKNTDCVYFLASPLTCKKGSECEYRHSEYARVNPRDCWFWMNGSCLNPKCSFRHPPLDNLIGSQTAGSTASSVMGSSGSSSAPSQAAPSAPFITAKQAAPCIFFQKGYCLKGDFCPFSHMLPYPTNSKPPQFSSSTGADSGFKKSFVGVEKCSQPKVHLQANASKPVDVLTASKASVNSTPALVRNGASAEHYGRKPPVAVHIELPKQKFTTSHPSINGSLRSKSGHATNHHASLLEEQIYQNGKEIDESLRESSPGFDVLVDDERGGPDYYGDEDRFPRIRDRDGRSVNEFEIGYSDDYRSTGLEMYNDLRSYDKHEEKRYARDHYRSSSERPLVESAHFDRRAGMYKGEAPDRIENVDLRQRLLKHKRGGGLRSVVSHDYAPENHHSEERHYKSSRRDSERSPQPPHHESSLGSRLQGRIRFPGKSSTGSDAKEEYDRARNRGRLSPTKPNLTSHRGRVQDRLSGRVQQDDGVRAPLRTRRDVTEDQSTNFTPPKSLAELKSSKQVQSKERVKGYVESTSLGKRKALEGSVDTEGDTSFEGPKPLSEILKKKRGVSSAVVKVPGARERSTSSSLSATADEQGGDSSFATDGVNVKQINKEENKSIVKDGRENHGLLKPDKSAGTESSKSNSKAEEKLAEDDGYEGGDVQDEEGEVAEGEYEYGQEDGEEGYNLEEGENGELAEEYMDEDDGDDFAKKIGVMFS